MGRFHKIQKNIYLRVKGIIFGISHFTSSLTGKRVVHVKLSLFQNIFNFFRQLDNSNRNNIGGEVPWGEVTGGKCQGGNCPQGEEVPGGKAPGGSVLEPEFLPHTERKTPISIYLNLFIYILNVLFEKLVSLGIMEVQLRVTLKPL